MRRNIFRIVTPYIVIFCGGTVLAGISSVFPSMQATFAVFPSGLYLSIALIFAIGFGTQLLTRDTIIPPFVLAIVFGIAAQPFFPLLTKDLEVLSIINEFLAALILFGSGVELPFESFKKHFGPIAALAFVGMIVSVIVFALFLEQLSVLFGLAIPAASILLTGALLAAVEPSAILPVFKTLHFRNKKIRDIAVAEGAVNDVTGTVLTRFFLVSTAALGSTQGVLEIFTPLLQRKHFDSFALELLWGIIVGIIGAYVLKKYYTSGETARKNPALFFAVPIFCFALGGLVGGSGFLAAFVAGLLYQTTEETHGVYHFFDMFNSYLVVPVIFVLLGAVIPISALVQTAGIGFVAALGFMFLIRPFVVFVSLSPWYVGQKKAFKWQELIFLSFIRETGGISAVLLLIIVASGIPAADFVFGIGFWVIFLTLMIEPPFTPYLTRRLGIAEPIGNT